MVLTFRKASTSAKFINSEVSLQMNEALSLQGEKMVVLTEAKYHALIEDAGDIALADQALRDSAGAPLLPADLLTASLDGTIHPLTAWRKAAGLTQAALADKAKIRTSTRAQYREQQDRSAPIDNEGPSRCPRSVYR